MGNCHFDPYRRSCAGSKGPWLMGSPHTTDICGYCGEPIIQWNNTGNWEHLGSAEMDQTKSRAYLPNAKTADGPTLCSQPKRVQEVASVSGKTNANHRTAKKRGT